MPPGSSSPGRVRRFFNRAQKVFKPSDQTPTSRTTSPLPLVQPSGPSPQPRSFLQPVLISSPQSPTRSPQPDILPQPEPIPSDPAPTASLSATVGDPPANAESSLALAAKMAGASAWSGFKAALRLLEKSSDVFPPLKSAVGGFLGVVDIFENAAQSQKNYAELASNLQGLVNEFQEHPGDQTSSNVSEALKAMASELRQHMEEQLGRSGFKRHVEAGQDVVDVQECYHRVENLRRALEHQELVKILSGQTTALDKIRGNQEDQNVDTHLKQLNAALKAMHDSGFSDVVGRRTCTPGTRRQILADMRKWADDPKGPKVYWLNGMAGTGKTTLAYSFCAEMQRDRRLGASFFCSRADTDSRDVSRIIPTISLQLARLLPSYCEAVVRQIREDKEIGARKTETQFEKLIRDPLREVEASVPEGIVVTIDALDECDRRDGAQDILEVLFHHARDLPIKFFVTCRPEPGLFNTLQSQGDHYRSVLHLHDIEASFVQADIKRYLEAELARASLSAEKLEMLTMQAGTLFIYAATAVRYIHPQNRQVDVHQRLENLLSIASKTRTNKHKGIDELYAAVLAAPFADEELDPQELENIRLVLDTAICAGEPISVTTMARLLELGGEQDVIQALQHLRSVLHVSQGTNMISTLHASFPDFMLDRKRSKDLCCNAAEHNGFLALRCFSTMRRLLRFNVCQLESSFDLDESIPGLARKIDEAISPELFYACRYWGAHLAFAEASDNGHSALEDFLSNRLLSWMEVLNLRKCIGVGTHMLNQAHAWLQKSGGGNNVLELALDAARFVSAFGLSPASRSTPHIYISALPFWPPTRPVTVRYWKRTQGLIRLEGAGIEGRNLSCLATWNTDSGVLCVAHSSDGTRIVFGSYDGTIRVCDAQSGALVAGPFKGHTDWVLSVAFSPDGTRIISGSDDKTIRAWDAQSGAPIASPFEGHTGSVNSVAFSPDGTRIVSSSSDYTIRVWDVQRGGLVAGPFKGNTGTVRSVAFSPDGTRIVSGSRNGTICVWDAQGGGVVAGSFKGHANSVRSVAFSPDGTRIASGSSDKTICMWDAQSGALVAGPFKGHTDRVSSVAFSPNGTRIVSGSDDSTIRVWDTQSGTLVAGPFEGHTNWVNSVAFLPGGTRIISGSSDKTICVWDAQGGALVAGPFEGHTDRVSSVAFSPNGTCIISGSYDRTICVWDAQSGALVAGPFKGHTGPVNSVAFSPNGTRIVSGSSGKTICVWDAQGGALVAGPFKGHTDRVNSAAFSPNGTRIVSGSDDSTIRVWDTQSGTLVAGPFKGHTNRVSSVTFSSNGTCIISGSSDSTIRVWDAQSGDLIAGPFEGHTSLVNSIASSPDSTYIVSGSYDRTIRVWDAQSGALVAGPFKGHTGPVNSVAFSPDGTCIVSGSNDGTICAWDAQSGALVAGPFKGHTSLVSSVAFSPDGSRIASGSRDNVIRVWATAPLHVHFRDWLMDKTGMVTTRQNQVLLYVPVDFWTGLVWPQNTVCIYAKGVLKLDFDNVFLGSKWAECYQCQ